MNLEYLYFIVCEVLLSNNTNYSNKILTICHSNPCKNFTFFFQLLTFFKYVTNYEQT